MKQLSICDVTLWGITQAQVTNLSPESYCEIAKLIDSLNVDEILIPDSLLSSVPGLVEAISSSQPIFAETERADTSAKLTEFGLSQSAVRYLDTNETLSAAGHHQLKKNGVQRIECELSLSDLIDTDVVSGQFATGVDRLILVDRSGSLLPHQIKAALSPLDLPTNAEKLSCRFRHDMGVSVANSLAAIEAGIMHLDCSILGIGPYAGYTPLEELATTLRIHSEQYGCDTQIITERLLDVNQRVSEILNLPICPNKPVSGENIFATEAGIHQDGLLKNPDTYLPYRPELVGAKGIQLVIGRHSGKRAVAHRLEELGHTPGDEQVLQVLDLIKKLPKGEKVTDDKLSELFART